MNSGSKPTLWAILLLFLLTSCNQEQVHSPPSTAPFTTLSTAIPLTSTPTEEVMETAAVQATQTAAEIPNEQGDTESKTAATISSGSQARIYSQEELIEDARQLAEIIESTHPDPYLNGGGKIAFHRRLHLVLNAIPEEGITRDEFMRILRPFVVAWVTHIPRYGPATRWAAANPEGYPCALGSWVNPCTCPACPGRSKAKSKGLSDLPEGNKALSKMLGFSYSPLSFPITVLRE